MGQKENNLKLIVHSIYGYGKHLKPTPSELGRSKYAADIYEMYSAFEGTLSDPPTNFGRWDISTKNFIIELDEERHFNRYRLRTLQSPFYSNNRSFSLVDYRKYCQEREIECLNSAKHGGYWKNDSTERQFRKSNENGVLANSGSSRWKQRAYYDFLKDISSKIMGIPLIRISIYDNHKSSTVEQLLKRKEYAVLAELVNLKVNEFDSLFNIKETLPDDVLKCIARGQADFEAGRFISLKEFKKKFHDE